MDVGVQASASIDVVCRQKATLPQAIARLRSISEMVKGDGKEMSGMREARDIAVWLRA